MDAFIFLNLLILLITGNGCDLDLNTLGGLNFLCISFNYLIYCDIFNHTKFFTSSKKITKYLKSKQTVFSFNLKFQIPNPAVVNIDCIYNLLTTVLSISHRYIFSHIEKSKHCESLTEKLCHRFRATR